MTFFACVYLPWLLSPLSIFFPFSLLTNIDADTETDILLDDNERLPPETQPNTPPS